jgi:hypothetical protein
MPHPCPHHCPPEGGSGLGGLVLAAAGVAAVAAVVAFIAAHVVLLAVFAAAFVAGIGGFLAWTRWAASPRRLHTHYYPRPVVRVLPRSAAQAFPEPRRRAVGPPRVIPAQVTIRTGGERLRP